MTLSTRKQKITCKGKNNQEILAKIKKIIKILFFFLLKRKEKKRKKKQAPTQQNKTHTNKILK
jgi:hypothetical protein